MATPEFSQRAIFQLKDTEGLRYWTGTTADGCQVLMGLQYPYITCLVFDMAGTLLRVEDRPTPVPAPLHPKSGMPLRHHPSFSFEMEVAFAEWKSEFGFMPGLIKVKRFFLEDIQVGILDRPPFYQEFIENPDEVAEDEEDKSEISEYIREWERKNMFVFRWGNDYWMDEEGEETSS